ncbi:hypothetical protein NQ315_013668 [Exocentrus adspersus]|uniref:CCHC-type domain-containing protein n=1 Tax=Exocentrus adspersus TaxID=1586481 RepID=A0AAV8W3I3_9CUCU|nr:hypothetical protein NQ315_013668 [Exocentrus adspersus]
MVNLAYPKAAAEIIEQLAVNNFVEGLRDPEFGQLVRLARHKTISEALTHAIEIEAVKEASRVATNPYQDLLQQFKNGRDFGSINLNGGRKPIRYGTCGAEGHMRKRCPQNVSLLRAPDPSPSTSQVRQIRVYTRQNQDVKMKKTYLGVWISQILEKYNNRRYSENSTFNKTRRIRCWICGAEGHMRSRCPQSCSDGENPDVQEQRPMGCYQAPSPQKIPHTVVRSNIVAHCRIQDTGEKYPLETARGEVIPVKGVYLAEIKIGNNTFKQKVFVADITDDVLLGLDFISRDFILDLLTKES